MRDNNEMTGDHAIEKVPSTAPDNPSDSVDVGHSSKLPNKKSSEVEIPKSHESREQTRTDIKAENEHEGSKDSERQKEEAEQEDLEDEETECGFCLFMKGGGCKDAFIAWEKCVEEADKSKEDIVEKCFEVTSLLKKCMDVHADYYEPILRAEKAMEEEAAQQLDKESASSSPTPSSMTQEKFPELSSSDVPSAKGEK